MRAVSSNPDLAASSGINVALIDALAAFFAGGLAGVGGALYAASFNVRPDMGLILLLPAFAVIVLGSVGSLIGALIAAFIVGLSQEYAGFILVGISGPTARPLLSGMKVSAPFVVLIFILLVKPRGIGEELETKFNEFSFSKFFAKLSGGQKS